MNETNKKRALLKPSKTSRTLPIALLRAKEVVMEPYRSMLQASNISEPKWRVLRIVQELGPVGQARIAEATCIMMPSLTRILKAMEQDGLLTRENDPSDRRTTLVSISESGEALIAEHYTRSSKITKKLTEEIGAERLETLLDLLEDVRKLKF